MMCRCWINYCRCDSLTVCQDCCFDWTQCQCFHYPQKSWWKRVANILMCETEKEDLDGTYGVIQLVRIGLRIWFFVVESCFKWGWVKG